MEDIYIIKNQNDHIINFASEELVKYLKKIFKEKFLISEKYLLNHKNNIYFGLSSDFPEIIKNPSESFFDDEIWIKSHNKNLVIAGSNSRSVLFAVYTLLEKLGFRWLYPGHLGEVLLPHNDFDLFNVNIHEKASLRFRGICLEGAIKFEQLMSFIDWMAKNKMNHVFIQFQSTAYFYRRYDSSINEEQANSYDNRVIDEIKKRGLILERVGHGWISHTFGFKNEGWDKSNELMPKNKQKYFALVNGKRELWEGVELNTQMCLSNQKGQGMVIDYVCNYIKEHPEIDIITFWLADGFNNFCECAECIKKQPTDLYIKLIKKLSKEVNKINLLIKITMLAYSNLIEPPKEEKFNNDFGNIIFQYAPITRCWTHELKNLNCHTSEPLRFWPEINKLGELKNKEHVKFIKEWRKKFDGDIYLFDYHNWLCGCRDFISSNLPKIINKDIKFLNKIGLQGLVSCQSARTFWPTGICMAVLSQTSWDASKTYKEIENDYLKYSFRKDANFVKKYLKNLYDLLVDEEIYENHSLFDVFPDFHNREERLINIIMKLKEFRENIRYKLECSGDKILKNRWVYLMSHLDFLIAIYEAEKYILRSDNSSAIKTLENITKILNENKDILEDICDFYEINEYMTKAKIKQLKDS